MQTKELNKEFLKQVGKRIAKFRKKRKMTQVALGDLCDMESASIARLEAGNSNATSLTLLKISKALDVPVKTFFDFKF
jgi:transcriptional regulator with XRE-family HTH domain